MIIPYHRGLVLAAVLMLSLSGGALAYGSSVEDLVGAFSIGAVLHFVSIIEEGLLQNRCPIANFYETLSMCAFLVTVVFLFVYWRYKLESLSVFIFPLVFVMALVATDLKRLLAYSTVSQLGYMVFAIGAGGVFASQFHLLSHAVFKALLFLAAGSVIHSVGTRDMRRMGGLGGKLPLINSELLYVAPYKG